VLLVVLLERVLVVEGSLVHRLLQGLDGCVGVSVSVCACVCVQVYACVCVCVHVHACVCVLRAF